MNATKTPDPLRGILIAVVITVIIGFASSLTMGDALTTWYAGLHKPSFNPPNGVFGPVWTVLYILMGIAAGLVWARGLDVPGRRALRLYGLQLVLNAAWTAIFFGLHLPVVALVEMAALILAVIACMRAFGRLRRASGLLLVPYLAWLAFAFVLNASIVRLN